MRSKCPSSLASTDVGLAGHRATKHSPKHPTALGSPTHLPCRSPSADPAKPHEPSSWTAPACSRKESQLEPVLDGLAVKPPILSEEGRTSIAHQRGNRDGEHGCNIGVHFDVERSPRALRVHLTVPEQPHSESLHSCIFYFHSPASRPSP